MFTIYLSIGTNLGNKLSILQQAMQCLSNHVGNLIDISSVYETAPWGNIEQPNFYNQVIMLKTNLSPTELLFYSEKIEKNLGKNSKMKWGPRYIDIDILYYDQKIIQLDHLCIPHKHLEKRKFVLVPLVEIAPNWKHPVLFKSHKKLLQYCTDKGKVWKVEH